MIKSKKLLFLDLILFYPIIFTLLVVLIRLYLSLAGFESNYGLFIIEIPGFFIAASIFVICGNFSIIFVIVKLIKISNSKLYTAAVIILIILLQYIYIYYYLRYIRKHYKVSDTEAQ